MGPRCFLEERHWSQTKAQIALNRFVLLVTCCLGNYETIGECHWKFRHLAILKLQPQPLHLLQLLQLLHLLQILQLLHLLQLLEILQLLQLLHLLHFTTVTSVPRGPTWHRCLGTFHGVIHELLTSVSACKSAWRHGVEKFGV